MSQPSFFYFPIHPNKPTKLSFLWRRSRLSSVHTRHRFVIDYFSGGASFLTVISLNRRCWVSSVIHLRDTLHCEGQGTANSRRFVMLISLFNLSYSDDSLHVLHDIKSKYDQLKAILYVGKCTAAVLMKHVFNLIVKWGSIMNFPSHDQILVINFVN